MGRVILSATGSGSGKTIITCGIMQALKNKGLNVKSYKCGPDYIDPMFHQNVLDIPSDNLDSFFSTKEHLIELLSLGEDFDISVIEGVMGIYDGLGGVTDTGSAYDLARITDTPIVLIVNANGVGRTIIPIVKGIIAEDTDNRIKGIILNRISESFYNTISPIMEEEIGVPVIGYLPTIKNICLESRHLGLKLPSEINDLKNQVDVIANLVKDKIDLERLMDIAGEAFSWGQTPYGGQTPGRGLSPEKPHVRLAVAKDEVFCFYYEENFRILKRMGVNIEFFSPIHDEKMPEAVDGLLLGGGYPELRLEELSNNKSMRDSIKKAIDNGMPSMAECGGFMYLHNAIINDDGMKYEMVGVIDGECHNTQKLCRFGYVDLNIDKYKVKGHEFHYFDSSANGNECKATKPVTGKSWNYGYYDEKKIWGFPHLYYPSAPEFVTNFIASMRNYRIGREDFNG